jgi:hypothetical protein
VDAINVLRRNKIKEQNFKKKIIVFQDKFVRNKAKVFLDYLYNKRSKMHVI